MPYCVHCGIRLGGGEKTCPLCGTPINDPFQDVIPAHRQPFSAKMEEPRKRVNYRFVTLLSALALLLPLVIVSVIDLTLSGNLTWSLYVFGAEICLWAFVVTPVIRPGKGTNLYIGIDCAALLLMTFIVYWNLGGNGHWYLPLALPVILLTGAATMGITSILRAREGGAVRKCAWAVFVFACALLGLDLIIHHYLAGVPTISWSWYAAFPIMVFALALAALSYSRKAKAWIDRHMCI